MTLYVLDTDILTLYEQGEPAVLRQVVAHPSDDLAVTIISVEEQLSSWYTLARRAKKPDRLAQVYERFATTVQFLAGLQVLPFPEAAILRFEQFKKLKLGVRAMDLRIAAIVLEFGGILVTRNESDFQRVPNLVFENWAV